MSKSHLLLLLKSYSAVFLDKNYWLVSDWDTTLLSKSKYNESSSNSLVYMLLSFILLSKSDWDCLASLLKNILGFTYY